jgi:hypothetical protein
MLDTPSVHERCHLSFKKDQTVKLCRRPEGADYFIGEVEIDGNPVIGSTCSSAFKKIES